MNLSQLYYFRALASCQHYTRAAESLFISQSALSHSMAALEADLGCQLFRKVGRNVALTDEGKVFQGYVDTALSQLDEGIAKLKEQRGDIAGHLRVGLIDAVSTDFFQAACAAYNQAFECAVSFSESHGTSQQLVDDLLERRIDVALTNDVANARLTSVPFKSNRVVVVVPRRMLLAARSSITPIELQGSPLYALTADTPMGEALQAFLQDMEGALGLDVRAQTTDEEALCDQLVKTQSVGLSLDTDYVAGRDDVETVALDAPGANAVFGICAVTRKGNAEDPHAREFSRFLPTFRME